MSLLVSKIETPHLSCFSSAHEFPPRFLHKRGHYFLPNKQLEAFHMQCQILGIHQSAHIKLCCCVITYV